MRGNRLSLSLTNESRSKHGGWACELRCTTPEGGVLFTGRYPASVRVRGMGALPPQETTFPEVLQRHGFSTGAFGNVHFTPEQYALNQLGTDVPTLDWRRFAADGLLQPVPDDPCKEIRRARAAGTPGNRTRTEVEMEEITVNKDLVAYCGLYCGACRSCLKGRCPGCHENSKASWCKVRTCCSEHGWATCADCTEFTDPNQCRKFNNIISKVMSLVLNSDRRACVLKVREVGVEGFAADMAEYGRPSLRRR